MVWLYYLIKSSTIMTISSQLKLSCNNLFFVHSKSLLDISDMIKLNIKSSLVFNAKDWMLSNLWRLLCYYFSLTKQEQKYETLNDHSLNPCAFHQLNMFVYFRILTIIYLSLSLLSFSSLDFRSFNPHFVMVTLCALCSYFVFKRFALVLLFVL